MALSFFDKIKKAVSNAIDSVPQIFPDTSHMKWEDRVKLYESLETVKGYVEAIRLADFHEPEDDSLVEVWASALAKHPEFAFDIYDRVIITNRIEIWRRIHEIHEEALKTATSDQQKDIKKVITIIEYQKLHDQAAKSKLSVIYDYDSDQMELAEKENWSILEKIVKSSILHDITDDEYKKIGHTLANYAESANNQEQAIEFLNQYSKKVLKDPSLYWRLAILYRDACRWDDYISSLKSLGKIVEKKETKLDILSEIIRIYHDILKDDNKTENAYRKLLILDPSNRDAFNYLTNYYEERQLWDKYISLLEDQLEESSDDKAKSEYCLRIASFYQKQKPNSQLKVIQYLEKAFALDESNQAAIDQLKTIYINNDAWGKVLVLLQKEANAENITTSEKLAVLKEMANIYRNKLIDENKLEETYKSVLDLVPNDNEAIAFLTQKYRSNQNWYGIISILGKKAGIGLISLLNNESGIDKNERFDSYSKLADLYLNQLDDKDNAVKYYEKCLEVKPDYETAIKYLISSYNKNKNWEKLINVYRKKLNLLKDKADQLDLLEDMAIIAKEKLKEDETTINIYELILEREPENENAQNNLEALKQKCIDNESWDNLLSIYKTELNLPIYNNNRIEILKKMIDIAKNKKHNNGLAIKYWNQILEIDPHHTEANNALERIISKSDASADSSDNAAQIDNTDTQSGSTILNGLKYISGVQAIQDRGKSKENKEEADRIKADIEVQLRTKRDQLNGMLESFGQYRLESLHYTVGQFLKFLEQIKHRFKENEYDFLKAIDIKENEIAEFKQIDMQASDALKTLTIGGGFMAIGLVGTPMLVTAGVTAIGAASTGTAISALSGAAAHSAVLAWLGGGSIAAGGGGMAAGAVVLGAITATATVSVAALAVGSLASAFYSKKNTESEQYLAEVSKWAAESRQRMIAIDGIKKRVSEVQNLTHALEIRTIISLARLGELIDIFDKNNDDHLKLFQQTALLIKSMSELAKTPILDEQGNINKAADIIVTDTQKVLNTEL